MIAGGREIPVGVVFAGREWAPSPPLLMLVNFLDADSARLRFASDGSSYVDDVYIDPYRKG